MPSPLPAYPFRRQVERSLASLAEAKLEPTGLQRASYLELAAPVVRQAAGRLDCSGLVRADADELSLPATAHFVAACAVLITSGRCLDLADAALLALDAATGKLATPRESPAAGDMPDLCVSDVVLAVRLLGPRTEPWRVDAWRKRLAALHPHDLYWQTPGSPRKAPFSWGLAWAAGEFDKQRDGIALWIDCAEAELARQLPHLTPAGMYRDADCSLAEDVRGRRALSWLLCGGYRGTHSGTLAELFRRGMLTALCTASPTGNTPEAAWLEGAMALACEQAATHDALLEEPLLAGAFKRQAHLAAGALGRRLAARQGNAELVEALGAVRDLCGAYLLADDAIAEAPAPCDVGGFMLELEPEFHRLVATCGLAHALVDPRTGRFELRLRGLDGVVGRVSGGGNAPPCGLGWLLEDGQWGSMAEAARQATDVRVKLVSRKPEVVRFAVTRTLADGTAVTEQYALSHGTLTLKASLTPAPPAVRWVLEVGENTPSSLQTPEGSELATMRSDGTGTELAVVRRAGGELVFTLGLATKCSV